MSCERFEEQIPDYVKGLPSNWSKLESHLQSCPSCRQKEAEIRSLFQGLGQWKNEPVPAWNRAPIGFFNPKRPNWLWYWSPLVAASILFVFVILNLEISTGPEGMTVRFFQQKEPEVAKILTENVVQELDARDEKYKQTLQDLLQYYQTQQENHVKDLVETALTKNNRELSTSIQSLNETWKAQRDADNRYWKRQINNVSQNTARNQDNLYYLANHLIQKR